MTRRFLFRSLCFFTLVFQWGCESEQSAQFPAAVSFEEYVVAVNNPLAYFAQRLIGDAVDVRFLAPEGGDPAMWRPDVEDVMALQGARLVLLNGAGYESWLDKVSISNSKLVNTTQAIEDQWIPVENQVTHTHGPGGEHAHGDYAFTTWMDMNVAGIQAQAVAEALQQAWPQHNAAIAARLQQLQGDLDQLDAKYGDLSIRLSGRTIIYSHPVYQYFERRYKLPGTSLHWEPDAMPEETQWRELERLASGGTTLFVWEGEPAPAIATRMEALGIPQLVIDPAANRGEGDWLQVQQQNTERLAEVR